MQAIDIINPEPRTELEAHKRKGDWILVKLISESPFSRKIKVTHVTNQSVCKQAGERQTNSICVDLGECSWFRHSMDSYHAHPELSNIPVGFDDEGNSI